MEFFISGLYDVSYFIAIYYIYFPFLICEIKCSAAALNIANCQNAYSITLAIHGIIELFRIVKREKELNREILAFSILHDYAIVKIYGYYAKVDELELKYYYYTIYKFDFTALEGKEK